MGLVSRTAYVAGNPVTASGQNTNEDAVLNEFNGNIENVNIKSSAAIVDTKLAQITTANKVTAAAIGSISSLTTVTVASGDLIIIGDVSDSNNVKKIVASDVIFTPSATNALSGSVIQTLATQSGAVATGTTAIPFDDTIPQITEGTEFMTRAITPNNTSNTLIIEVTFFATQNGTDQICVALFQDATANALAAVNFRAISGDNNVCTFTHTMAAGTTSATTFRVRAGTAAGNTVTFNGTAGGRLYGGVAASSVVIQEIKA